MHLNDLDSAGRDLKEALAINPKDPNTLQLDGDLLMKLGRTEEAINVYSQILAVDPKNRFALTSLGYASRTAGRDAGCREVFPPPGRSESNAVYPLRRARRLYTARRDFREGRDQLQQGVQVGSEECRCCGRRNECRRLRPISWTWQGCGQAARPKRCRMSPRLLREEERYLSFKGDYRQSAAIGEKAIKMLPKDRDVVVYLGYDLLNLQRYDELLALTAKYSDVLPKEPDLPLVCRLCA